MSVPAITEPTEDNLLEVIKELKEIIEILLGRRGESDDKAVTELRIASIFKGFGFNIETGEMRIGTNYVNADCKENQLWCDTGDGFTIKRYPVT